MFDLDVELIMNTSIWLPIDINHSADNLFFLWSFYFRWSWSFRHTYYIKYLISLCLRSQWNVLIHNTQSIMYLVLFKKLITGKSITVFTIIYRTILNYAAVFPQYGIIWGRMRRRLFYDLRSITLKLEYITLCLCWFS